MTANILHYPKLTKIYRDLPHMMVSVINCSSSKEILAGRIIMSRILLVIDAQLENYDLLSTPYARNYEGASISFSFNCGVGSCWLA